MDREQQAREKAAYEAAYNSATYCKGSYLVGSWIDDPNDVLAQILDLASKKDAKDVGNYVKTVLLILIDLEANSNQHRYVDFVEVPINDRRRR